MDLAVEIFALQGITVEYRVMSWESAIKDVRSGKIDGIIAATVNDAPDFVFPHEPVLVTRNTFWTRTGDKWVFTGIKSLTAKRLGLVRSYNYGNKLNTYANEHKKNERKIMFTSDSDPLRTNINRLIKGEVDVIVDNYETIVSEAKLIGAFEEIRLAGEDLSYEENCFVAFSPKKQNSQRYAQIFSDGLKKMKKNGRIHALKIQYGVLN